MPYWLGARSRPNSGRTNRAVGSGLCAVPMVPQAPRRAFPTNDRCGVGTFPNRMVLPVGKPLLNW